MSGIIAEMRRIQVDVIPEIIWKINNNGFGGATDNNPLERDFAGRIDLLVREPRGDIEEIPCLQRMRQTPLVRPTEHKKSR